MSFKSSVAIPRQAWELLRPNKKGESFSNYEAFSSLVFDHNGKAVSRRSLAVKWGWSKSKVQRFLAGIGTNFGTLSKVSHKGVEKTAYVFDFPELNTVPIVVVLEDEELQGLGQEMGQLEKSNGAYNETRVDSSLQVKEKEQEQDQKQDQKLLQPAAGAPAVAQKKPRKSTAKRGETKGFEQRFVPAIARLHAQWQSLIGTVDFGRFRRQIEPALKSGTHPAAINRAIERYAKRGGQILRAEYFGAQLGQWVRQSSILAENELGAEAYAMTEDEYQQDLKLRQDLEKAADDRDWERELDAIKTDPNQSE